MRQRRTRDLEDHLRNVRRLLRDDEGELLRTTDARRRLELEAGLRQLREDQQNFVRQYLALCPEIPPDLLDDVLPIDAPPLRIFLSYRRDDAREATERLAKLAGRVLGEEQVFLDTRRGAIRPGSPWQQVLDQRLREADALLVVIGPSWLHAEDERGRRLEQVDDPVRHEIESALRQGKHVLPVLVDGASCPRLRQVPPSIQRLFQEQALRLGDATFEQDFQQDLVSWFKSTRAFLHRSPHAAG